MESKYIFGIDLGTTYSAISYLDENYMIQTCSNEEGDTLTPSVVDLTDDGNPLVGKSAKDNKVFYPFSVLDFFKRQMDHGHDVIYYGTEEALDKETSAIKLSAEVLKYLAKYASDTTDSLVEAVVITVPAYFGTEQKQATKEAAELAGFKSVRLIEEPTAAAVYYGYKGDKNETVLVYDLGGGTFDVVAVEIDGYNYDCFAVEGDDQLGGKEWDSRMVKIIMKKLADAGVEESDLEDDEVASIQNQAEKTKRTLTSQETVDVRLKIGTKRVEFKVTREEFEAETADLLERTIERTSSVKKKAEDSGRKITKILLVGGSSYMPQVQRRLIEAFPDVEVPNPMDPNMAVSKGAAYYAKAIIGEEQHKKANGENTGSEGGAAGEFEIPTSTYKIEIPLGTMINIKKVAVSSIGIKGIAGGVPKVMTLLQKGSTLPVITDIDLPISQDAIAAGQVEINLLEHRLEDKYLDLDNPEAELKELQKQCGEISQGLPSGAMMHIHMEISDEGLLVLTATDPNSVEIKLEATADTKSAG